VQGRVPLHAAALKPLQAAWVQADLSNALLPLQNSSCSPAVGFSACVEDKGRGGSRWVEYE